MTLLSAAIPDMRSTDRTAPFKVCIVLPCRDEQGVVTRTAHTLLKELDALCTAGLAHRDSYLCCVDDGSRDGTWPDITRLATETRRVRGIKLSARFGHPNALIAGLFSNRAMADILITIDADLQDDPCVLRAMLEHHRDGKRVVYGVRLERQVDGVIKGLLASAFYQLMRYIDHRAVRGHADFRSADAEVIADLERFSEANLYLRGLFPLIGYPSAEVHFTRQARQGGRSKYSYLRLAALAWQGITSFSTAPLRLVFVTGLLMTVLAIALGAWVVAARLSGNPIEGWASIALLMLAFSSVNLISLGIIGEYVGKIYKEVKQRPRYIIETMI